MNIRLQLIAALVLSKRPAIARLLVETLREDSRSPRTFATFKDTEKVRRMEQARAAIELGVGATNAE